MTTRTKAQKRVTAYTHPDPEAVTQQPDPQPGRYFVTARRGREGSYQHVPIAGPFPTHQQALDTVSAAQAEAERIDPRAIWYAYGTCREIEPGTIKVGILNERIGIPKEGFEA